MSDPLMNGPFPLREYASTVLEPGDIVPTLRGKFKFVLAVCGDNITYVFQSIIVETVNPHILGTQIIRVQFEREQ